MYFLHPFFFLKKKDDFSCLILTSLCSKGQSFEIYIHVHEFKCATCKRVELELQVVVSYLMLGTVLLGTEFLTAEPSPLT